MIRKNRFRSASSICKAVSLGYMAFANHGLPRFASSPQGFQFLASCFPCQNSQSTRVCFAPSDQGRTWRNTTGSRFKKGLAIIRGKAASLARLRTGRSFGISANQQPPETAPKHANHQQPQPGNTNQGNGKGGRSKERTRQNQGEPQPPAATGLTNDAQSVTRLGLN